MLLHNTLHHQACFYRKYLFNNFRYCEEYQISADYELNLKIYIQKKAYKYIDKPVSIFRCGGASSRNINLGISEMKVIRRKYVGYIVNILMVVILKIRGIFRVFLKPRYYNIDL